MPEINILSPHVADLIAAGEVVERPASVIKELLENAFDAGAKTVVCEIKGGGMTYIRVTDDGCGMSPEDAGICHLRHATSKLRDERGLESIGTMGFRGEALAAISAVSRIELQTRREGDSEGTRVTLEGGDIIEMHPCGCPVGTTMIVRDLFYNTPARLKFMKSDRSESGACVSLALRCALGRPDVSVRMIRDGEDEFFSPGDGKLASAVYSLLGRDTAKELLELSSDNDGIAVSGFVGSPKFAHGNRAKQFFFVNGRCIRSQLLQAAVEQAYKNTLLTGRFPSCVVNIGLSCACVDVNVHPAKTEVKFREERRVFDAVYYAALSAIEGERASAEIKLSPSTAAAVPKKDFFKNMSASEFRESRKSVSGAGAPGYTPPKQDISPVSGIADRGTVFYRGSGKSGGSTLNDSQTPYNAFNASPRFAPKSAQAAVPPAFAADSIEKKAAPLPDEKPTAVQQDESIVSIAEALPDFRLVGEAMKTYIIIEQGDSLIFIDKHAAHERMIFDRLKAQGHEIMSQTLLTPVPLKLTPEETELLEQNGELLNSLGFEIEPYGESCVVLRAAPADTDAADAPAMLEEICRKLSFSRADAEGAADEILHTVACKAAIKAGWTTTDEELCQIAGRVLSGEVKYCPHGRPVSFKMTKKQLDKEFSRIL